MDVIQPIVNKIRPWINSSIIEELRLMQRNAMVMCMGTCKNYEKPKQHIFIVSNDSKPLVCMYVF
jgi:hypothetical protein